MGVTGWLTRFVYVYDSIAIFDSYAATTCTRPMPNAVFLSFFNEVYLFNYKIFPSFLMSSSFLFTSFLAAH